MRGCVRCFVAVVQRLFHGESRSSAGPLADGGGVPTSVRRHEDRSRAGCSGDA